MAVTICNALGAALVTYLYLVKAVEQASLQRGYEAYGGEYLIVPFVFYGVYKLLCLIPRAYSMAVRLGKAGWQKIIWRRTR